MNGIRACLEFKYGHTDVSRVSFAVQGAGQVGHPLVKSLREAGAKVFVTDINDQRVEQLVDEYGAEPVPMAQIYDVDANGKATPLDVPDEIRGRHHAKSPKAREAAVRFNGLVGQQRRVIRR